ELPAEDGAADEPGGRRGDQADGLRDRVGPPGLVDDAGAILLIGQDLHRLPEAGLSEEEPAERRRKSELVGRQSGRREFRQGWRLLARRNSDLAPRTHCGMRADARRTASARGPLAQDVLGVLSA